MDSFEEDPHANPPNKGEGTLPRALIVLSLPRKDRRLAWVGANGSLPPPCGEGLGVGVRAGQTSQEFHVR
ncbi:hypothetical protein EOB80_25265 [Mesorhizobium sp. M7A.F.Ca.MR.245.00.0.0]|nr:hypothetical protein EOB80_25265 [Mesorhizobium sp. M7A.F.Ca.MR.245.00.0.0]